MADGALRLQARREQAVAWNGNTYNYTSGMVSTGGRKYETQPGFVFTYGYVEARVKVPAGQGLWPAVWLLPANYQWPPEIDVMEILGDEPDLTHMHYHYLRPDGTHADVGSTWRGPDFSAGWHTFAVDWRPDALVWYVDGVERARLSDPAAITSEPSYLLLNLAVGGDWPGAPDQTTVLPADYLVDHVRIWQPGAASSPAAAPVVVADTTSPSVTFRSPTTGAVVGSRTVSVDAVASDNVGVVRTDLLIDGVLKTSSATSTASLLVEHQEGGFGCARDHGQGLRRRRERGPVGGHRLPLIPGPIRVQGQYAPALPGEVEAERRPSDQEVDRADGGHHPVAPDVVRLEGRVGAAGPGKVDEQVDAGAAQAVVGQLPAPIGGPGRR